ncbi:MAG: response regulator receiver protein [Bacteroidetes bacterium]|jgi:DNA-binding NarL/FixJ family response regulator|nr:response regulator receiver protein [Bacteroidota bacterium]
MFLKKAKKPELIFIVEDNKLYAKTLQAYLKLQFREGTMVETFPVGELCIDNLHRNPDFVIMDYYLNSRFEDASNGFDIARHVKKEKPKTEVIVLSGQNNVEVVAETISQIDCKYVVKNDEAYERVSSIIGHHYK